jgi:ribA/ribD-fused uncharacterized protein
MKKITRFNDEYFFLSNFYPRFIRDGKLRFKCVESAFQSYKCEKHEDRFPFQFMVSSYAKRRGRSVKLRPDWEKNKIFYMYKLVLLKFRSHRDLQDKLLETGDAELIEGNNWHDNYWGDCYCPLCKNIKGQNHLGKILMRVRDNLRAEPLQELRMSLPDGTTLSVVADKNNEYPYISISLIRHDGSEEKMCFAEYDRGKPDGKEVQIGVYARKFDEPVYYDSYN